MGSSKLLVFVYIFNKKIHGENRIYVTKIDMIRIPELKLKGEYHI